ncbi:uncharacterized protein M421DRAFT_424493 [Didymella exigua CBS 183.55]|uniref:CFEM domain-containing protein n=1 Tax=Didymella exigua CBS 183.55 TaxID=1150837 RepID=A0A6A5RB42_9PLEO|nr:uncharacterized protein M421DRAFT_424493 [Didymella exigua CBS 183.55]KAF1924862.1 hypothetical protein M421DRAFT_424493 [Didymella exigua CBS 183.55]
MRFNRSPWLAMSIFLLISLCRSQTHNFSSLPSCAQNCVKDTFASTTCHPLSSSGASCACRDTATLDKASDCIATSCGRKDQLSALNLTFRACTNKTARDRSTSYRHINVAFYILAILAMGTQWLVRFSVGRLHWLDDGSLVMVLAVDTLLFVVCYKMSWTGLGRDIWNVPFEQITITLLHFWVSEIAYFSTLGFVKISFLLFFLQIFPEKRFRRTVWTVIWLQIASIIAFDLAATFVCTPISFAWERWDGEHTGKCINNNALAFTHAAHSILTDFVTLSLPITQIWNLHLGLKKKIGVLLMFSVGAFVTVVSMLRLRSLVHFANTTNMTWDYLEASLWSVIECQVAIICTCMPSIRLGLSRLFPNIMGSTNHSTAKDTGAPSRRSHALTAFSGLTGNEINVQTTFKTSHMKKGQTNDDERSFVQLVEIEGDSKSVKTSAS